MHYIADATASAAQAADTLPSLAAHALRLVCLYFAASDLFRFYNEMSDRNRRSLPLSSLLRVAATVTALIVTEGHMRGQ